MNLSAKVTKLATKAQVVLSKRSPELWVGAGILVIIGGTIMACKATTKLDDILDEHGNKIDDLKIEREDAIDEATEESSGEELETALAVVEKNHKREVAKVTVYTGLELAKEYAPAVIMIAGGIGMIINGHRILCKRNATLLAAYTALEQTFTDYRGRVKEKYGAEEEEALYSGTTYIDNVRTEVDEDGKKHKVKEQIPVVGKSLSPYARFFDEANSTEWTRAPDYNHTFVICQQNQANDKLRRRGYLFLNEVYRMLGLSETPTGAICGWILPEDADPLAEGDTYVDFKIFDGTDPAKVNFVNGDEKSILLDFNCQGIIYDKI